MRDWRRDSRWKNERDARLGSACFAHVHRTPVCWSQTEKTEIGLFLSVWIVTVKLCVCVSECVYVDRKDEMIFWRWFEKVFCSYIQKKRRTSSTHALRILFRNTDTITRPVLGQGECHASRRTSHWREEMKVELRVLQKKFFYAIEATLEHSSNLLEAYICVCCRRQRLHSLPRETINKRANTQRLIVRIKATEEKRDGEREREIIKVKLMMIMMLVKTTESKTKREKERTNKSTDWAKVMMMMMMMKEEGD